MYEIIQTQAEKLKAIYRKSGFEITSVKSARKEPAMIAVLKFLLQNEDYEKKSEKIDFTPDRSIIMPTSNKVVNILKT